MGFAFLGRDIAVDLGTANTLVYVRKKGIVLDEPSVVAINLHTGKMMAVGKAAREMIGRTPPHVTTLRPLRDGVIADLEAAERMLRHFIQLAHPNRYLAKPRVVVAVPSGTTSVEQRAVKEAAYEAGARRVELIEEPMAAAIGAGLNIGETTGNMVVDIGGGTTEVAIVSMGGVVVSKSVRVGGDELDEAIVGHVKKQHSLLLGERTAEHIKLTLGTTGSGGDDTTIPIRGRDLVTGLPKTATISRAEVREAIEDQVQTIVDAVQTTLDQCPAELAGDLLDNGVVLTGGGSLLDGLPDRLREAIGMPIHVVDEPLHSVVLGAGRCVEQFDEMRDAFLPETRR
ncbi:rod shape-determining protein [Sphaerimonospora thailandensis]|uniref:Cell shape-determining protein MreB n=1 Tax=Sphaerimonospora thailandensis TaxID=795644 RepID=A0A8J3R5S5_9ACTN|nr:rod shape-determining protein [Sphaerimonospora thailandensis]GIH68935.1 rod shape-determining protein [Sphaerimonospora thailandensis]